VSSTEYAPVRTDSNEINVISMLHVAWRYKFLIIGITVACTLFALYLALTAKLVYRAEAVVTEVSTSGMGNMGGLASRFGGLASLAGINLNGGNGDTQSAVAVLNSRHLAEQFVADNKLVPVVLRGAGRQSVWLAADYFRQKILSITESKEKGTITIAAQWTDPKVAAQWVNDYIALANETLRVRALEESSRNIKYLNEQIGRTDVVGVQKVMYELIESETKSHMLANTRKEYAFTVVDPASAPEDRIWPRRSLMVGTGMALGGILGLLVALVVNAWVRYRAIGGGQ
jgi:uncharacterized protein involved in exopolysaccharide biosynthesis